MRRILTAAACLGLAACAADISETERQAQCLRLFKDYDRQLILPTESEIVRRTIGSPIAGPDREAVIVSGLRQYSCAVQLSELPDLAATAERMQAFGASGVGRLARPEYLHAGLASNGDVARALTDFFRGLGYPTRETGAPGLGRRIWVGPLDTVEARRGAEALARAAGLGTAYTVTRLPYPR